MLSAQSGGEGLPLTSASSYATNPCPPTCRAGDRHKLVVEVDLVVVAEGVAAGEEVVDSVEEVSPGAEVPRLEEEVALTVVEEGSWEDEATQDRQTTLFSATHTKMPVYIGVDDGRKRVNVEGLHQGYYVIPSDKRFLVLYAFLKRNQSKKVMVFFSSCNWVKFHSKLLRYIQADCLNIHGKQRQQKRTSTFFNFKKKEIEYYCVPMLLLVDLISLLWTGLFSMIYPMSQRNIFMEWDELLVGKVVEASMFAHSELEAKVPVKEYEFNEKKVPIL